MPENKSDADRYQALALRTEKTPAFVDNPAASSGLVTNTELSRLLHGLLGITSEAGEIADMVKKHLIYGKDFDRTNVLEEAGDLLWYIALALDSCGYSFADAMSANIRKLDRRYPNGFTQQQALNRNLTEERKTLESPGVDFMDHEGAKKC